jgi:hypothetical protein
VILVAYASHPIAEQLASPPNVVGPSALASLDTLKRTRAPLGVVASPDAKLNCCTHDARAEHSASHVHDA